MSLPLPKLTFSLLAGLLLSLLITQPAAADSYLITDLGTLPGGTYSIARGINDAGQVVGQSGATEGTRAFLWEGGTMQNLGILPGYTYSYGMGVNNAGQVAGWSENITSAARSFLWQSGSMQDLGTLGGSTTRAFGINNSAQVVGSSTTATPGQNYAFLWQSGTMQNLGSLPGGTGNTWGKGINNAGQVVGYGFTPSGTATHAFLWQSGAMQDLGTLGGRDSHANAINNLGQVVGGANLASGAQHGYMWQGETMTSLGLLPGTATSNAFGINDAGDVVGFSDTRAVLWKNGQVFDLNSLIPLGFGWSLRVAYDINESGQIVGEGVLNGVGRGFLLTPFLDIGGGGITNPEPTSLLLLASGVAGLSRWRKRKV